MKFQVPENNGWKSLTIIATITLFAWLISSGIITGDYLTYREYAREAHRIQSVDEVAFVQRQFTLNPDIFNWSSLMPRSPTPVHFWSALAVHDFDGDAREELVFLGYSSEESVSYFVDPSSADAVVQEIPGAVARGLGRGILFTDFSGDGREDLVVVTNDPLIVLPGSHKEQGGIYIFRQTEEGSFERDVYLAINHVVSPLAYDYDRDGDMDLLFSRYNPLPLQARIGWYLDKVFVLENQEGAISSEALFLSEALDWDPHKEPWSGPPIHQEECGYPTARAIANKAHDFAITLADINHDAYLDMVVASDFRKSYILRGREDGSFTLDDTSTFHDCNAMGSVLADFDHDGDLDWFTTNIFDSPEHYAMSPSYNWGTTGNQIHTNDGQGVFHPHTMGLQDGAWAWGACAADFNRDGFTDIAHVTGASLEFARQAEHFRISPMRLFLSRAGEWFTEAALESGLVHTDEERALVCHDFDQDGDIDIASLSIDGVLTYSENQGKDDNNYLSLEISGPQMNPSAFAYRVYVETPSGVHYQQIQSSDHFNSKGPHKLFFGLNQTDQALVSIVNPQGEQVYQRELSAQAHYRIELD